MVHRLRLQYGDRAPSPASVKRWMERGRWTARRRHIEELVAQRSDELRGRQIAEAVTSNQIVEGAIQSARSALSDQDQLLEVMIRAIRQGGRIAGAGRRAEEEPEQETSREAAK
ncbi:MAG: hypothetical protein JSU77_11835 [Fidelibacterota bacterium]|nr:MAG: hypothetical protein JSU77_11835 [Candidatus Neomarinimicrobiota bacterium]